MPAEPTSPWTILGVVAAVCGTALAIITGVAVFFRWLFGRQSTEAAEKMHSENQEQFVMLGERLGKLEGPLGRMDERLQRVEETIGHDSNSGMRGSAHKRKGQILVLAQQIDAIRDKCGMRPLDLAEAFRKDHE